MVDAMEQRRDGGMTAPKPSAPLPTAPPTTPHDPRYVAMLLDFLKDHDVHCPRCDYNLRALTQPVCPECREELHLPSNLPHSADPVVDTLVTDLFSPPSETTGIDRH